MPSVVVGLLLAQVALGALVPLRSTEYNAAGCAASALMSESIMDTDGVQRAMGESMNNMECKDTTDSGFESSTLWYCNESILTMAMYFGDAACNESLRFMTMAFDCRREGEEGAWLDKWSTLTCNPDLTGRTSAPYDQYNTSDCSNTKVSSGTMNVELGGCDARSEFSDSSNSWTPKSERVTEESNGWKVEHFGTADCSGAVTKTQTFTCETCGDLDPDDNETTARIFHSCMTTSPTMTSTATASTTTTPTTMMSSTNPSDTSHAFQCSVGVISVVLMLLSFRA